MKYADQPEYIKAKNAVLTELLAAGWGFAIAEWTREDGEILRANNELYYPIGTRLQAYSYDEDNEYYTMGVHKELMAIAEKHGCYWENINQAETGLYLI